VEECGLLEASCGLDRAACTDQLGREVMEDARVIRRRHQRLLEPFDLVIAFHHANLESAGLRLYSGSALASAGECNHGETDKDQTGVGVVSGRHTSNKPTGARDTTCLSTLLIVAP
jgi:hypothetical protein